jgi:hypothetical protein
MLLSGLVFGLQLQVLFNERRHPYQKHDLHDGSMVENSTQKDDLLYNLLLFRSGSDHSVTKTDYVMLTSWCECFYHKQMATWELGHYG